MQEPAPADSPHSLLLDNWRGWAIVFVLLGHFIEPRGANFGRLGVELFFVLSGRLMADLLFIRRVALPRFYYRRATRVLPVSLLFVLTAFAIFPVGANHLSPQAALASAALVINYTQLVGINSLVTGHFWSLCIEEHSYLALGLLAWAVRRRGNPGGTLPALACLGLAALMMANGWRLWHAQPDYYAVYWRSDVRAATIFASVGLRIVFARGVPAGWRAAWIPLAAAAAGLALNTNHVPDPVKYSAGSLLIALAINTLEQAPAWVRRCLASRHVAWVGSVSYSVYIWQQPFYDAIAHYPRLPMLAGAVATGVTITYVYEQPLRRWLNAKRAPAARAALI